MEDIKKLIRKNYLQYASYVILDRAIPHVIDGLKPVQRRILHTLNTIDDGKFQKVANVVGQTMAYHPHGDASINDALVNMANKRYLFDRQGNFGNLFTGDHAAAARYIETRLSPLARDTLFNKDLTSFIPSYDGRKLEPTCLPAKIPLALLLGAEGIALGMSTRIFPHNFTETLEAEISVLEGKEFSIIPDFQSAGIMDASQYDKGNGKIKLRARITIIDEKTLVIEDICYGTTTESLIRSIDDAAKKGKIRIEGISDYTSEKVEIEIKLPRGQYAKNILPQLYAFTDCEVSISPQCIVIKDQYPWETNVEEILRFHVDKLKEYLKAELEIEKERTEQKIFEKTLEQIFIENRLYKKIENVTTYEKIATTIDASFKPYHSELSHEPTNEDFERLLAIPIRRISKFDIEKNQNDIGNYTKKLVGIEKSLKNIKKYTIKYLKDLIKKYGHDFPRRTKVEEFHDIARRAIATRKVRVYFDQEHGFIGTKVSSDIYFDCTDLDKVLLMYQDGTYSVMNIPEKYYVRHHDDDARVVYVSPADKKTIIRTIYRDLKTNYCYAKAFIIKQFILERRYNYIPDGTSLELITTKSGTRVDIRFKPKTRQKVSKIILDLDSVAIKSVSTRGTRIASKEVKKVKKIESVKKSKEIPQEPQKSNE